jgi:hypothetical protein
LAILALVLLVANLQNQFRAALPRPGTLNQNSLQKELTRQQGASLPNLQPSSGTSAPTVPSNPIAARPPPPRNPPPAEPVEPLSLLYSLIEDLNSNDNARAQRAAERLLQMEPTVERPKVARALEKQTANSWIFTRKAAIAALGVWGTKESVDVLLKLLHDHDHFSRVAAMEALTKLKDERATKPLAKLLLELGMRREATKALKQFGAMAEAAVLEVLDQPDWPVRKEICQLIQEIGTRASLPKLRQCATGDPNRFVREAATRAFRAIEARTK